MSQADNVFMHPWKHTLAIAESHAQQANFAPMRVACEEVFGQHLNDPLALLNVGALWFKYGFISDAVKCFERITHLNPHDFRAWLNLANCYKDLGNHQLANELYLKLQAEQPNNLIIRRNVLISQQYSPAIGDAERFRHAKVWGDWAIAIAGGPRPRPSIRRRQQSPLKVGYVSADLCQHTVGLFVKDVLKAHQPNAVEVFAYYSGQMNDWVTQEIRSSCTVRDVLQLDDGALAHLIREDQIDVLVDLSGHTAGSRLSVFAHRPAPVQLSWLGYFATTGLAYVDAVLLDQHHAPAGTEDQFVENVVHLEGGRFCYQPVPWAPEVATLPSLKSGHITFGSFNNTGKLNADVYDVWANVLQAVPDSQLILKWRTLIDPSLCQTIRQAFQDRGIDANRIELRPASFHVDVLKEYADIDIALDPFPFTGGLTSCEALWMGVPVVTLPQTRVVSRQTLALLSAMGKTEWVAKDADDYVSIARTLAADRSGLANIRASLRSTMQASSLMDVTQFTRALESAFCKVHQTVSGNELPLSK